MYDILTNTEKRRMDMAVFSIAFWLLTLVAMIKVFIKMGYAGWEAIVPLYNVYILFKELYGSGWKMLLTLIPLYNIYVIIKFYLDLAHAFGKTTGFGIGILFLSPIFMCILGFDDSTFTSPVTE